MLLFFQESFYFVPANQYSILNPILMAEPFLSEIRLFSFNFAPKGWAFCNGQLLPINQNQALFALLGTTFGGDGRVSFALPDYRGRVPIHAGSGHTLGEKGGEQAHTITQQELPTHTHTVSASTGSATTTVPVNNLLADTKPTEIYNNGDLTSMHPSVITTVGSSQAHLNMQPFLVLSFCIALQGIFPSQN